MLNHPLMLCHLQGIRVHHVIKSGLGVADLRTLPALSDSLTLDFETPYRIAPYESGVELREANSYLQMSFTCGFVNATFEERIRGRYDFLDGLVTGHVCTPLQRMHEQLTHLDLLEFTHYLKPPTLSGTEALRDAFVTQPLPTVDTREYPDDRITAFGEREPIDGQRTSSRGVRRTTPRSSSLSNRRAG
jgi:hypothetical protein